MIVLFVWLMWFAVTCCLTLVGILVIAGAACLYVFGWLLAQWKPTAGAGCMAVGKGVFMGTGQLIDRINGKQRKQPGPTVVIHTIHTIPTAPMQVQPPPAAPEPPQRPPPPSKAQQIADAKAAYVKADLIDEDDDPALLEQRIGAIVGVGRQSAP
jgi:hypothetical protein